ncbi:MAG: hypothetical protein L3J77_02685, partial [Thermoplasmata archaeon]|nr:hypothetical protein [Thermoplasmata archaeon]
MTDPTGGQPMSRWRRPLGRPVLAALLFSVLAVLGAVAVLTSAPRALAPVATAQLVVPTAATTPSVGSGQGPTGLSLGISVTPGVICVTNNIACPGDQRSARVTMSVAAPPTVTITYPAVQVIFLLETT